MSQINVRGKRPLHRVLFGVDHALGWFITVLDDREEARFDKCTAFDGLGKTALIDALRSHVHPEDYQALNNEGIIRRIALDLDPVCA